MHDIINYSTSSSAFIFCLKYLMAKMITERLKLYVPYFYMKMKYKFVTVRIKNKKGGAAYLTVSKGTQIFSKNTQNKLRQKKKVI